MFLLVNKLDSWFSGFKNIFSIKILFFLMKLIEVIDINVCFYSCLMKVKYIYCEMIVILINDV